MGRYYRVGRGRKNYVRPYSRTGGRAGAEGPVLGPLGSGTPEGPYGTAAGACGTTAPEKRYCHKGPRYYRDGPWYYRCYGRSYPRPEAQRLRAVLPLARYYRSPLRYYRKDGLD